MDVKGRRPLKLHLKKNCVVDEHEEMFKLANNLKKKSQKAEF